MTDANALSRDCQPLLLNGTSTERFWVTCKTHGSEQADPHASDSKAWRAWECDGGRRWRFIIEWGEDETPRMTDLSGLKATLVGAVEHNHYAGEPASPSIYRYLGEGRTERLDWAHVPATGEWVNDDTSDSALAHSYPQYRVTGPDGTLYLTVTVALAEC